MDVGSRGTRIISSGVGQRGGDAHRHEVLLPPDWSSERRHHVMRRRGRNLPNPQLRVGRRDQCTQQASVGGGYMVWCQRSDGIVNGGMRMGGEHRTRYSEKVISRVLDIFCRQCVAGQKRMKSLKTSQAAQ